MESLPKVALLEKMKAKIDQSKKYGSVVSESFICGSTSGSRHPISAHYYVETQKPGSTKTTTVKIKLTQDLNEYLKAEDVNGITT